MNVWLEVIGWVGSGLVVWSLMQARVLRFRWMNLAGSVIAAGYNAWVGIWPFAAMNAIIAVIDVYWLVRLYREAHDAAVYEVVEVEPDDAYLQHVLKVHAGDIAQFHPAFDAAAGPAGPTDADPRSAFLVVRGDETVGSVIVRDLGDGSASVELDWVKPRFRDFTVGEFVHRSSGVFTAKGFRRVVWDDPSSSSRAYLERLGFAPVPSSSSAGATATGVGTRWERVVA
ncbi:hypothetical protein C8046_10495 [Serinibacter arcticus]|uniref:N-acetyltransferase domain-containing protein n=1 Tax=Serinibacter arcticus TaxID=1655435 RepID=A0A2U1ZVL8_9MICO|nr:hypothetical protein [Serinibacter arcticus]PWD51014.1 hypothetical protein C8046_10495 [Serinibacter arcticus]